jgi:hypothetical protein
MLAVFSHHQDATQRLSEIAAILAAGLLRLRARKSSAFFGPEAKTPLDCARTSRGDARRKSEDITP